MARPSLERVSQREYARRLGISNELVSRAVIEGRISKGWDAKAKKIIVVKATEEWGALYMKTNVSQLLQQEPGEPPPPVSPKPATNKPTSNYSGGGRSMQLSNESSYAEAKRVKEIIQAQLAALDLKERKEELVKKDEVYKQLFAFGQGLRVALSALPDRVLDLVLASKGRIEAYQLLSGEIHSILEGITQLDFDFTPRQ